MTRFALFSFKEDELMQTLSFIKRHEVLRRLGISKSTLRNHILDKLFPPAVVIGGAYAWPVAEVNLICRAYLRNKSEFYIRQLVEKILACRENGGDYESLEE